MCTSLLGILKINCPDERSTNTINISMSVLNQKLSETIAKVNQQSKSSYVLVQNQKVTLNGYPTYGIVPDLKILQEAKLNLTDVTTLKATINSQDMTNLSNSVQTQFDDLLKQDSPFVKQNTDNIVNLRNAITTVIKSSATLTSVQKALSESLSVQNQEVIINFAPGMPDALISEMGAEILKSEGRRPVIQIDQTLVNNILKYAAISSVISAIKNDTVVNQALAKFGKNKDCEMTFSEDTCNKETNETNLRGKVTTQPEGKGITCLNLAKSQYPTVTWRQQDANNFIAVYPCVQSEPAPNNQPDKQNQQNQGEQKSDLEKQIEKDIQKEIEKDIQKQLENQKQEEPSPTPETKPDTKPDVQPPTPDAQPEKQPPTPEIKTDNTMMYAGAGIGLVLVIAVVYFLMKRNKN
jgi:hypothetical protein